MTPLLFLARSFQPTFNLGQGLRGVDDRNGAQAGGVCYEAGEDVGAHLALARARLGLDDPEQTGRYAGAVPCVFQKHELLRLAQFDLDWQSAGRSHSGADDTTPLLVRQYGGDLMAKIITRVWTSRGPTGKKQPSGRRRPRRSRRSATGSRMLSTAR